MNNPNTQTSEKQTQETTDTCTHTQGTRIYSRRKKEQLCRQLRRCQKKAANAKQNKFFEAQKEPD